MGVRPAEVSTKTRRPGGRRTSGADQRRPSAARKLCRTPVSSCHTACSPSAPGASPSLVGGPATSAAGLCWAGQAFVALCSAKKGAGEVHAPLACSRPAAFYTEMAPRAGRKQ